MKKLIFVLLITATNLWSQQEANPLYQADKMIVSLLMGMPKMGENDQTIEALAQKIGFTNVNNIDSTLISAYIFITFGSIFLTAFSTNYDKDSNEALPMIYLTALTSYNTTRQRLAIYKRILQDNAMAESFLKHEKDYLTIALKEVGDLL